MLRNNCQKLLHANLVLWDVLWQKWQIGITDKYLCRSDRNKKDILEGQMEIISLIVRTIKLEILLIEHSCQHIICSFVIRITGDDSGKLPEQWLNLLHKKVHIVDQMYGLMPQLFIFKNIYILRLSISHRDMKDLMTNMHYKRVYHNPIYIALLPKRNIICLIAL